MKKGGIFMKVLLIIIILLAILILLMKLSRADSFIVDISLLQLNSSNISISINGTTYYFNSSNFTIEHNFSFTPNFINASNFSSSVVSCNNATFNVSCSCPQSAIYNVSCSGEIDLPNATKALFFDSYQTELKTKIQEASDNSVKSIVFQLEPTRAELDACKQTAYNASVDKIDAEKKASEQYNANLRIADLYGNCKEQKRWLQIMSLAVIIVGIILFVSFSGVADKLRNFGGEY